MVLTQIIRFQQKNIDRLKEMEQSVYHTPANHLRRNFSIEQFQKYFLKSGQNFGELSRLIKDCNLTNINCRFNVWRLCLGAVSIQSTVQQKRAQITQARQKYQQKKDEALKSINMKSPTKEPLKKNPLMMMGAKSSQNKEVESDSFLKEQIQKDVQRTYQQMKFFQDKHILKILSLILFIWCRRNTQVSYKQGMNELLASVINQGKKKIDPKKSLNSNFFNQFPRLWSDHLFFNSVQHAYSDIYSIFEKIIQIQGDMYKTEADLAIKSKVNPNSKNNTPILQRIMHIKDHKLKHMDLQLFRIIKLQDVQTKTFMLRWIRCMHTREFDLQNSFVIWDSIFLEFLESQNSRKNKQFQFIDAMCLAMFMYMRSIVFTKQTAGQILQVYQKYPALKRGQYLDELITLAWSICEQLQNQSQSSQTSSSNWFEQSEKVQSLHFIQKKPQKKHSQPQPKTHQPNPKKQPVQKQLKQHQHKKNPQITKKHSQPVQYNPNTKVKQAENHSSEVIGGIPHNNKAKNNQRQRHQNKKQKQHPKQKSGQKTKDQPIAVHHRSQPYIQRQIAIQSVQGEACQQGHKSKSDQIKQIREYKSQSKQNQSIPTDVLNPRTLGPCLSTTRLPQNIQVTLSSTQIAEILEHLTQSLPNIRDIDAQSHIRKTIKKIEGKVKMAKQKEQLQAKNKLNKGFPLKPHKQSMYEHK